MRKKPTIAFMYDFDKTLCDQDMQNYTFIPNLNMSSDEFWSETEKFSKKNYKYPKLLLNFLNGI